MPCPQTMIDFSLRVSIPDMVLFRELDGESVLLNLKTESYLGLDDVGTRMWTVLTAEPSVQAAYEVLLSEYDVLSRDAARAMWSGCWARCWSTG